MTCQSFRKNPHQILLWRPVARPSAPQGTGREGSAGTMDNGFKEVPHPVRAGPGTANKLSFMTRMSCFGFRRPSGPCIHSLEEEKCSICAPVCIKDTYNFFRRGLFSRIWSVQTLPPACSARHPVPLNVSLRFFTLLRPVCALWLPPDTLHPPKGPSYRRTQQRGEESSACKPSVPDPQGVQNAGFCHKVHLKVYHARKDIILY